MNYQVLAGNNMNNILEKYNITKLNLILIILTVVLLAIAIPITIMQVQNQQNTKSKASSQDDYKAFGVTDTTGKPLEYKDENGLRTYETKSLDVKIKVNNLENLTN